MLKYDGDIVSLLVTILFFGAGFVGIILCIFLPKSLGYDSFEPSKEELEEDYGRIGRKIADRKPRERDGRKDS